MRSRRLFLLFLMAFVSACALAIPTHNRFWFGLFQIADKVSAGQLAALQPIRAAAAPALWISPAAPAALRQAAEQAGVPLVAEASSATARLEVSTGGEVVSTWLYALVAPFPTVTDGVTSNQLLAGWKGQQDGPFAGRPLLMDESTLAAFTSLWGAPVQGAVRVLPNDELLGEAWSERPSWAIVPFESLDARWKVLSVDGQSPIQKDFEPVGIHLMQTSFDYPLIVKFSLRCSGSCPIGLSARLPASNRDPARLTTVVMTGVTALVRATAYTMDTKGITYPGRDIRNWLADADITHISNEVPFADNCPAPDPGFSRLVFCSNPRYIELLESIGADVIELTGNHYADYGPAAMLRTLQIYGASGMSYYGGGADLEDARKPLLLQKNGNKIAFIGCNSVDVGRMPTATDARPGAAPCDFDYMESQIRELRDQGYLVIASFQYYETYEPTPFEAQMRDFRRMAEAGAVIVQGSQAHNPQSMEFRGADFIHYGLGNLFFDQMGDAGTPTRQEFIDRHVFYDGRYISTELLTAELEDYARPRPMTPEERAAFLSQYFAVSGW